MSIDAQVERQMGSMRADFVFFFSWRMKVLRAHVRPFFLFFFWSVLQIFLELWTSLGQVFRVEPLEIFLFDSRFQF